MAIKIDDTKCEFVDDCPEDGICLKSCKPNALYDDDDELMYDESKCEECGICVEKCPLKALSFI